MRDETTKVQEEGQVFCLYRSVRGWDILYGVYAVPDEAYQGP